MQDDRVAELRERGARLLEAHDYDSVEYLAGRYAGTKNSELWSLSWLLIAESWFMRGGVLAARSALERAASCGIAEEDRARYERLVAATSELDSTIGPRFRPDPGALASFTDRVLVRCPRCGTPGVVTTGERSPCFVCHHCRYTLPQDARTPRKPMFKMRGRSTVSEIRTKPVSYPVTAPTYHGCELYLQTRTRHGVLWAYNEEHLAQLKALVSAKVREDTPHMTGGSSWANRLPNWITSAKNRDEITRALTRIEKLLDKAME